jgi:hypothetical protein
VSSPAKVRKLILATRPALAIHFTDPFLAYRQTL